MHIHAVIGLRFKSSNTSVALSRLIPRESKTAERHLGIAKWSVRVAHRHSINLVAQSPAGFWAVAGNSRVCTGLVANGACVV